MGIIKNIKYVKMKLVEDIYRDHNIIKILK